MGGYASLPGLYNGTLSTEGKGAGERRIQEEEGRERWKEKREEASPVTLGTPYGPENSCLLQPQVPVPLSSAPISSFHHPSISIQVAILTLERLRTNLSEISETQSSHLFTTRKWGKEKDMKGTVSLPVSLSRMATSRSYAALCLQRSKRLACAVFAHCHSKVLRRGLGTPALICTVWLQLYLTNLYPDTLIFFKHVFTYWGACHTLKWWSDDNVQSVSPFSMWVPEMELRSSNWCWNLAFGHLDAWALGVEDLSLLGRLTSPLQLLL